MFELSSMIFIVFFCFAILECYSFSPHICKFKTKDLAIQGINQPTKLELSSSNHLIIGQRRIHCYHSINRSLRYKYINITKRRSLFKIERSNDKEFWHINVRPDNKKSNDFENHTQHSNNMIQAAFLVAGTTIGGGFLALPTVIAPVGFVPSAFALFLVWCYFILQSFILVECIVNDYKRKLKTEDDLYKSNVENNFDARIDSIGPPSSSSIFSSSTSPSISSIANSTLGKTGENITRFLIMLIIQATLVSQISRAGTLLYPNQYAIGCALSAVSIALLVFGPSKGKGFLWSTQINSIMLWLFLASAGWVGVCSVQYLKQSSTIIDWTALYSLKYQHWNMVPEVIPTFLQLLVYGEIIPVVCNLLNFDVFCIKMSIFGGALLTLGLQLGWSGLGTLLVPPQLQLGSTIIDPVTVLLNTGGSIRTSLFCLALTAILTTILGSYLALISVYQDWELTSRFFQSFKNNQKERKDDTSFEIPITADREMNESWQNRLSVASIIVMPSLIIASISPTLFLKSIAFAGSYPVVVLFGIIPSIMAIIQRVRDEKITSKKRATASKNSIGGSNELLYLMLLLSLGLVGCSLKKDLTTLIHYMVNTLRSFSI